MRLTLSLTKREYGELLGLAALERRTAHEQAAWLVAEGLKRHGTPESRARIPAPHVWNPPPANEGDDGKG